MSDKAPDAFRTISEVAEDLDLPQHVLRFWETRFPQIKPLKRGGGRRYYRPDDVILLRGIRHLLYGEGYTIKGVQRILKENGVKAVQDVWRGQDYDPRVSPDPANPHFSLSFGGEAFFVVGLHPNASRPARRFERPTLTFNLHDQFEQLRALGKYETIREKILTRDERLAGSRNPMLARHGEASEARQYSGRAVDDDWRAPFVYGGDRA